jgi:hypothetical protein
MLHHPFHLRLQDDLKLLTVLLFHQMLVESVLEGEYVLLLEQHSITHFFRPTRCTLAIVSPIRPRRV